jgi:hypothetical protein
LFLSELDGGKSWNLLKVMDVQICGSIAPSSAYVLAERLRFFAFADVLQLPGVVGLVACRDPEMVTRPAIDRLSSRQNLRPAVGDFSLRLGRRHAGSNPNVRKSELVPTSWVAYLQQ